MKNKEIKNQIRKLIVNQFKIKKKDIKKSLSANNVAKWDSLGHLSLITIIEKKFKISFTQEEIVKMLDEKNIFNVIKKKY
tara:strand:- start:5757 stop:5996 length:240 start_codon:yes stop_codon:yes gene_type:complete